MAEIGEKQPTRAPNNFLYSKTLMPDLPDSIPSRGRTVWFGIAVGFLAQLGLRTLLPMMVLFATRTWSQMMDSPSLWMEYPDDSRHPVWYALQASVCAGSILAGIVAAILAPRRSLALPVGLVTLSLIANAFEQFPRPLTTLVNLIWTAGPCVGLLIGVLWGRRLTRRRSE